MKVVDNYCPACGAMGFVRVNAKEYRCQGCGHRYFHNVAAAVAGVITCGDEVLFAVRAHEPARGLLDFPGGFIDPDESLEQGLLRELQEELGWQPVTAPRYLFSGFNTYDYAGVSYKTVDAFFHIESPVRPAFTVQDDVAGVVWLRTADMSPDLLAFEVMREAVRRLRLLGI
jgi:ADP-ribose pyrophosphatase YjhB (NUDIX family)